MEPRRVPWHSNPAVTTRPTRPLWIAAIVALSSACDAGPVAVFVDLRTDYQPGLEVASARTELDLESTGPERPRPSQRSFPVARESDLLAGQRIAEFPDVPLGTHTIRVELLDASGTVIAMRRVRATISGAAAIGVVITRNCRGVTCPGPGDAAENTECLDGRCVPPECTAGSTEPCGEVRCALDSECPGVGCAVGVCAAGVCFLDPRDGACPTGMRCHSTDGCVPAGVDGGTRDAGPPACDVSSCDDGVACTVEQCLDDVCANVPTDALCDDGIACTTDRCEATGCTNTPDDDACDDGVSCTIDRCGASGCTSAPDDARCDDGVDCTLDTCGTSGCTQMMRHSRCDDGNGCTDDVCTAGGCEHRDNDAPCDDGRFCNGADRCGGGRCSIHAGNPCDVAAGEVCSE